MQMFQLAETGSIRLLWIIGTNPAVSLPELGRIRRILAREDLFVVVSDAFLTETAALADLVLPAALWGEKTGCTTNADRTVHLSEQAIEPPGEARSDLDVLLDYARRMDFRDRDGDPLVKWTDAEGAFDGWRECSRGRPCDYSGMTYAKLRALGAIQWPCTDVWPEGKERQYEDGVFNTSAEFCETYGHDLATGAAITPEEYAARDPKGRAVIKGADYLPPPEQPDDRYPFLLTTGRVTHHFHTRTKTGRAPALNAAAPRSFVELSQVDAGSSASWTAIWSRSGRGEGASSCRRGWAASNRASCSCPSITGTTGRTTRPTAANRLTISGWDPVSKQPHFKYAAVAVSRARQARDASPADVLGRDRLAGERGRPQPAETGRRR